MISKALVATSARPLLLGILRNGESYGYQIVQKVKKFSDGGIELSDGMLYPVLHKLEKEGFISSEWKISDENRMRKYYRLTEAGKKELETEIKQWVSINEVLYRLWGTPPVFEQ
ncbi:MAG: PadR family transcriptional regulator [Flavobacterium sp.]|nr:PadR family transcriptional regulator [Flavobacterium sp.]